MGKKKNTALMVILAAALIFAAAAIVYGFATGMGVGRDEDQDKEETPVAEERNILLLGLDARGNGAGRTDTIMVLNVDPEKGELNLLSIPRDTRVPLNGSYDRINAAYVYGGTDMVMGVVEDLLGIELDHYAIIDFQGFIEVVDLLGGVEANVPVRMYHPHENINLQPGVQLLDGEDALAFARYRYTANGDIDRAKHQQEILQALWAKALSPENIPKIPELIKLAAAYIDTDVPKTEMLGMAATVEKFQGHELTAATLPGESVKIDGLWYYTAYEDQLDDIALPFKKDMVE